jgi:hypothetical protein
MKRPLGSVDGVQFRALRDILLSISTGLGTLVLIAAPPG